VVPSKPVCATDIFFDDPALTEQANLIALSGERNEDGMLPLRLTDEWNTAKGEKPWLSVEIAAHH
jgi:hypothetical protein